MSITLDSLLGYLPHIMTIGGFAVFVLMLRMRGEFATKSDLAALAAENAKTATRVENIERDMRHLPTREDIHKVQLALSQIDGTLAAARVENAGLKEAMMRLEGAIVRHEDIISTISRNGGRA